MGWGWGWGGSGGGGGVGVGWGWGGGGIRGGFYIEKGLKRTFTVLVTSFR